MSLAGYRFRTATPRLAADSAPPGLAVGTAGFAGVERNNGACRPLLLSLLSLMVLRGCWG